MTTKQFTNETLSSASVLNIGHSEKQNLTSPQERTNGHWLLWCLTSVMNDLGSVRLLDLGKPLAMAISSNYHYHGQQLPVLIVSGQYYPWTIFWVFQRSTCRNCKLLEQYTKPNLPGEDWAATIGKWWIYERVVMLLFEGGSKINFYIWQNLFSL